MQITALLVIPMTCQYWVMLVGLIVICGIFFNILSYFGQQMLNREEEKEKQRLAAVNLEGLHNLDIAVSGICKHSSFDRIDIENTINIIL